MAMYSIRALSKWRSALVCPLCLAVGIAGGLCATAVASDEPKPDRVVHSFDFDERDEGNLEDLPKFWMPVRPSGFPQFAQGGFDFNAGLGRNLPRITVDRQSVTVEVAGDCKTGLGVGGYSRFVFLQDLEIESF